jgi:hypothetical protein
MLCLPFNAVPQYQSIPYCTASSLKIIILHHNTKAIQIEILLIFISCLTQFHLGYLIDIPVFINERILDMLSMKVKQDASIESMKTPTNTICLKFSLLNYTIYPTNAAKEAKI